MKNFVKFIILFFLLAIIPSSCAGQAKVFKSVASMPDVTSVYIGPAAMRFAQMSSVLDHDKVAADAVKSIKSLEVIECDEQDRIPAVAAKAQAIIDELKLEVILETKDDGEACVIYGLVSQKEPEYLESLLIVSRDEDEYSLVYINGKINIDELMEDYR